MRGMRSIGTRIRRLRKERGWLQADLAERTSISRPQIANIESGNHNPSVESLTEIALALEVPVDDLLDDDTVLAQIRHRPAESDPPTEYMLSVRLRVTVENNRITQFVVDDAVAHKVKSGR